MGTQRPPLDFFLHRLLHGLRRLVSDRRVLARLELGSSIALASGLVVVAILFFGAFQPVETLLSDWLFPQTASAPYVAQDRLVEIVMIFLLALLAGATLPHLGFLSAAALALIYYLLYLAYAFRLYDNHVLAQPLYPGLALGFTFSGAMLYRYIAEERPRAFIGRLLRRVAPPDTIERVMRSYSAGNTPLSGTRRVVTLLCIDLRDFNAHADTLAPETLIEQINECLKRIAAIVFRHEGAVVRHSSDELIAVWNLPLDQFDHAQRAGRAALEIRDELREWTRAKKIGVQAGVGIATGIATAGNVGTRGRREYGVIGEVVMISERLAGKAERGIYIDARAREEMGEEFTTQESSPIRLRARAEPLVIWRVIEASELEEPEEEPLEVAK